MLLESDISTKYVHVKWMKMNDSKMARFFSKKNLGGPIASVVYNGLDKLSFDVKIPLKKNLLSTLHNELKPRGKMRFAHSVFYIIPKYYIGYV